MNKENIKIIGIIAARMNSSRFPGKMNSTICGVPLLEFVIKRALKTGLKIILATGEDKQNNILEEIATRCNIETFRGDLDNVALRFLNCSKKYNADFFIRINGDSPLVDHQLIQSGSRLCTGEYDIITNVLTRSFPYGISFEAVKVKTFENIINEMKKNEMEHITSYFYNNIEQFKVKEIISENPRFSEHKFVIDTPEELISMQKLIGENKNVSLRDLI